MEIKFRVDWGYQYLYSRRHYHPVYIWDGKLECTNGSINEIYLLDYVSKFPVGICGAALNPHREKLDSPEWKCSTKRGLKGISVKADVSDDSSFNLTTVSGNFTFSAKQILEEKRIEFAVGPKYQGCYVTVTLEDYYWFRQETKAGEKVFEGKDFEAPIHEWMRMKLSWVEPEKSISWQSEIPSSNADYSETLFHIEAMCAPYYSEKETWLNADIPMQIYCDGELIIEYTHRFRYHGYYRQLHEDVWLRHPVKPGKHTFTLKNLNPDVCLAVGRIIETQSERNHGELSLPSWGILDEELVGKVFSVKDDTLTIAVAGKERSLDCHFGWNEFKYSSSVSGIVEISSGRDKKCTEIYDVRDEKYPIKVGFDMTHIVHDESGELDWILDYTQRTRLGNYVVFRNFLPTVTPELLEKWGSFCREHGIYVSASRYDCYMDGSLIRGAGEYFSDCGQHEFTGKVYAFDPTEPHASNSMKEATEKFRKYIRDEVEKVKTVSNSVAFGDGSGAIRHTFLEGVELVRAETMVGHTMTLLSQARPAAEALGKGRWGVHIAISHAYSPYRHSHLRQYFLSLMQPWVMGAEILYEEDSLFGLWSEERQTWGDLLTRGKRDITRQFYKFAKTHPRKGQSVRNIGFIEGRYAAPFNGFICGCEQDPHYSVWGLFGNNAPQWGHGQPEKARQLLDVLMPGASTHPFRQKFDKRRFLFSGTPYGDFDCIPVESNIEYFNNYKLLLNLGWNTCIDEDYQKLCDYVKGGGILLTGIPQFSRHIKRDFLKDMGDLNLYNNGDLTELCGFKVLGRGEPYSGSWNCNNRENILIPELSSLPSDSVCEDGEPLLADIELSGAEVIAWDSASGLPMLVRNKFGKGYVYTFTLWAYPGHELFQSFSAAWISKLSEDSRGDCYVIDDSREVFWTTRIDGDKTSIIMLNTDWTTSSNEKEVTLVANGKQHKVKVREGVLTVANISGQDAEIIVYDISK